MFGHLLTVVASLRKAGALVHYLGNTTEREIYIYIRLSHGKELVVRYSFRSESTNLRERLLPKYC
jgi:hypothetical protein